MQKVKDITLSFLVLYILWGWIFTKTVFASNMAVYACYLLLLLFFLLKFILKCKSLRFNVSAVLWFPFYLYIIFRFLIKGEIESVSYWTISAIIVLLSSTCRMRHDLPYGILKISGVIALTGICFQLCFPSLYSSSISPLFASNANDSWTIDGYGLNGFTYQLAVTAEMLIFAELSYFFVKPPKGPKKNAMPYIIAILCAVGVFLTGKRMNSLMAVAVPMLVIFLSSRISFKKVAWLCIAGGIAAVLVKLLIDNALVLMQSGIVKRFAGTIIEMQAGKEFGSGRGELWATALKLFNNNPVFGIGPGTFRECSGYGTDVHNMYIQCLCELGLFGLFLFAVPLFYTLAKTIRLILNPAQIYNKQYLMYSLGLQLTYIIEGITENMNNNLTGFPIYAIAVSLMIDCSIHPSKNESEKVCI